MFIVSHKKNKDKILMGNIDLLFTKYNTKIKSNQNKIPTFITNVLNLRAISMEPRAT